MNSKAAAISLTFDSHCEVIAALFFILYCLAHRILSIVENFSGSPEVHHISLYGLVPPV